MHRDWYRLLHPPPSHYKTILTDAFLIRILADACRVDRPTFYHLSPDIEEITGMYILQAQILLDFGDVLMESFFPLAALLTRFFAWPVAHTPSVHENLVNRIFEDKFFEGFEEAVPSQQVDSGAHT